jgi:hypothetical protein
VDADLARKEGIRSDYYGAQTVGKVSSASRTAIRPGRRNGRDPESDIEVPSEDSEEDDDDDDDEDEDTEDEEEKNKQAKVTPSSSSKSATTGGTKEESGEDDMEAAFKKFLQFQKKAKK